MTAVLLVGAGVVGRAIAADHLLAGIPVWIADLDEATLSDTCDALLRRCDATAFSATPWGTKIPMPVVQLMPPSEVSSQLYPSSDEGLESRFSLDQNPRWLMIESIAERLPIKQQFFAEAEKWFQRSPILTSNTSTLSIESISQSMQRPERFCGLHFFMPVVGRNAAEVIAHPTTSDSVLVDCHSHLARLQKQPIAVRDAPGFIVNRMLATYMNLSLWLLCGGVHAKVIRQSALNYGMPMSPLELMDLIGTRTAFDGGRVVWQAFPKRMDPSPLLPAMVKRNYLGVADGTGFYCYDRSGTRQGDELSPEAADLVQRYEHDDFVDGVMLANDDAVTRLIADLFAMVMFVEAQAILRDQVADRDNIEVAMQGGLGYVAPADSGTWWNHVDVIAEERLETLRETYPRIKSLQLR